MLKKKVVMLYLLTIILKLGYQLIKKAKDGEFDMINSKKEYETPFRKII